MSAELAQRAFEKSTLLSDSLHVPSREDAVNILLISRSPESTLRLPLALSLALSSTVANPARHSPVALFLFPLLTFTPKSVAVYRRTISVAPLDKRNFGSHLCADCYFRGSWQTQKSQSPSCQWETPPLSLTNCPPLERHTFPPGSQTHHGSKTFREVVGIACLYYAQEKKDSQFL